jgi:hypothetical protein
MKTIIMSEQSLMGRGERLAGHIGALGTTAMEHFGRQGSEAA